MYTFSRGSYLAILVSVFVLGVLKDRKLLVVLGIFLLTWQVVVPVPVRERVNMTVTSDGELESSANERVQIWQNAEESILKSPIVGSGFATFQYGQHVDDLRDTHNWYVKVLVETGIIGLIMAIFLLQQILSLAYKLFRRAEDPLYRGLGLGLFVAMIASMTANCFGDRWTLLEITGMLWVLIGAAVRAQQLIADEPVVELIQVDADAA
jgi:putative inorganic carbon (hco3(-)) transporter